MLSNGQLSPIVVRLVNDGYYEIVDGSHRLAAVRLNKWTTIRCEIRQLTSDRAFFAAWSANANRNEFMDGIAEGRGFEARIREGYTQTTIAREIGRPQQYISSRISLLRLELEIQELITRGLVPVEHGIELSRLDHPMSRVLAQLCRRDSQAPLTLEELRALTREPWEQMANDPRVQPLLVNDPIEQIRQLRQVVQRQEGTIQQQGTIIQEQGTRIANLERRTDQLHTYLDTTSTRVNNMSAATNDFGVSINTLEDAVRVLLEVNHLEFNIITRRFERRQERK